MRHSATFRVHKIDAGYAFGFRPIGVPRVGVGAVATMHLLPESLRSAYGVRPWSLLAFVTIEP